MSSIGSQMPLWCAAACFATTVCGNAEPTDAASPSREIAYTAGPDGAWFTADDTVHHYYRYGFNARGEVTERSTWRHGADGMAFTRDDVCGELERYTLNASGHVVRAQCFSDPGPDGAWGTTDDRPGWSETLAYGDDGHRTRRVRRTGAQTVRMMTYSVDGAGREIGDIEYRAPGPDEEWGTADDLIEKVHRHRFDADGRRTHSEELHADHDGRGRDGRWFTDDDIVSSTKRYFYDAAGRPARDLKAVGVGPDGLWFTDDDVLQYYTLHLYDEAEGCGDSHALQPHTDRIQP